MKTLYYVYKFIFRRLVHLEKWLIFTSLVGMIVLGFAPLLASFIFKKIVLYVDIYVSSYQNFDLYKILMFFCVFYVILISLKEIVFLCCFSLYNLLSIELTFDIQLSILKKIKRLSYKTFFNQKFQNLYSNVLKNSSTECFKMITTTVSFITALIEVLSIFFVLIYFKIEIVFSLIFCSIPSILIRCKTQNKFISVYKKNTNLERKNSYLFNVLTDKNYLKEIRLFNLEDYFYQKREINFEEILFNWKLFGKKEIKKIIFAQIFSFFGILFSEIYVINMMLNNAISVSDFIFFSGIIISFQSACGRFGIQISESYKSTLFINQLFEFFDLKEDIIQHLQTINIKEHNICTIKFHNVTFKYPGQVKNALYKVNLKMNLGEKISIVGKNGCGKSTLINLLLRHYIPTSGYISLNGIDIQKYDLIEYRKLFSGIYQDFQKFAVPVNEFIAFGNISNMRNVEKLRLATKKTMINNLVENLPKKYETHLTQLFDPDGLELSGGQWQKLAASRAFFSENPILIFDEPTSALDAISEAKIYSELNKIKGKLIIFISHRAYTLQYANKVIYMENGMISAIGSHNELFNKCKNYKKLFNRQFEK